MLHTITCSFPKLNFHDDNVFDLVLKSIKNNEIKIDYFGLEPASPADYIDDIMQSKIENSTIINIYFSEENINYDSFSEIEILDKAINLLSTFQNIRIETNENEIDIYL